VLAYTINVNEPLSSDPVLHASFRPGARRAREVGDTVHVGRDNRRTETMGAYTMTVDLVDAGGERGEGLAASGFGIDNGAPGGDDVGPAAGTVYSRQIGFNHACGEVRRGGPGRWAGGVAVTAGVGR